jgi:hypothetical protein
MDKCLAEKGEDMKRHGVVSFRARKQDDDRVIPTLARWLREALPALEVHSVADDPAYWGRDIDLVCVLDGHRFTVEVKADQLATTTGNLFLETVSVEAKPSAGWLALTQADLLFYYCASPPKGARSPHSETDCLYVFVTHRLRDWFLAERQRLLRAPRPETGEAGRKQARADRRAFKETWRIRATHTADQETGQYQHTTLGWTVPLDYVRQRYFQDAYGQRADQMRQLMVIADVAGHLDRLGEVLRRYAAWAGRREGDR